MTTQTVPVGDGLLGRAIDASGRPLDERGVLQNVRPTDAMLEQPAATYAPALWDTGIEVLD